MPTGKAERNTFELPTTMTALHAPIQITSRLSQDSLSCRTMNRNRGHLAGGFTATRFGASRASRGTLRQTPYL